VLLDQLRTESRCPDRHRDARRVIRQAHGDAERLVHRRHRAEVHDVCRRRIDRRAPKQRDRPVLRVLDGAERVLDLTVRRHARRDDHRHADRRGLTNQRQIDNLERRNLHRRHADRGEAVDCVVVERRREERDAARARELGELRLPLARKRDRVE
jgi:hypothetical protein